MIMLSSFRIAGTLAFINALTTTAITIWQIANAEIND